jgi:quercetin dioxygenase-like cupin family protein
MNSDEQDRGSFVLGLGALGISPVVARSFQGDQAAAGQGAPRQGFVLGFSEGEHLVHFRDQGSVFIKIGAATGSDNLALGTQQLMGGSGIPIHRHFQMDEAFYVLEGSGTFILNDVRHPFQRGGTIFIPKNSWHGFENPDHELLLLWVVTPAGLDGFFREICSPVGVPPKRLSREQVKEIALRYGTEFR